MAAVVQHARTRPARVAANSSRPLQPHPHHAGSSSSQASSASAPLGVFLTNLRLLDLDLLPDWPGITPETFATSGSGVLGQKRRVQCVEWALFRLFSLWDPEETANKLKPFFPPLDQMQSLNLRAALLRALEHAKKNGVLGRDSAIRKTMLDECKGERLEEVLAYFSTAVLKKAVADDANEGRYPALAAELALENRGYGGDNAELGALALAHRVSLRRILERKDVMRSRCRDLADLLSVKERSVARRIEVMRARDADGGAETLSDNAREEMRRTVRNNWSGNERWMQTLLLGDSGSRGSGLLAMPFDRVWRRVQQGRLEELEEDGGGLLEQLDGRVRVQKERLARWDAFRSEMLENQVEPSPSTSKAQGEGKSAKGIDLNFGGHQDLHVGGLATRTTGIGLKEPPLMGEYGDLVDGLRDELAQIRNRPSKAIGFLARHRRRSLRDDDDDAVSEMSELEDEPELEEVVPGQTAETSMERVEMARRLPVRPQLSRSEDSQHSSTNDSSSPATREAITAQQLFDPDMEILDPPSRRSLWDASPPASPSLGRSPVRRAASPAKPSTGIQRAPSPTHLADQILASMADASPSPTKRPKARHTLSLAQRTRLSMARANSNPFLDGEAPEPEPEPGLPSIAEPAPPAADEAEEQDDLASRTRRSMAGFERAQQRAQLERRRSLRRSKAGPAQQQQRREGGYFPRVDEETAVLAEELMGGDEDMEAVFRSRPRIKASPVASPTRE